MKIAHVINIFTPPTSSDLYEAQPITLESMRIAAEFAQGQVDVALYSAHFKEDEMQVPGYFSHTAPLTRTVGDVASFIKIRKLPLIHDILKGVYEASDADYLIYTNNDIILQPAFYLAVKHIVEKGHDAFIINRRRIPAVYSKTEDLPLIWAETGKKHPGFDCFVFKREIFPQLQLGNICIGAPFFEVTLAHNLFCFASNFRLFDELHLTTHLGMKILGPRDEYYWHNRREFNRIFKPLKAQLNMSRFPYAERPFFSRYIKWGLNPGLFVFMNFKLECWAFFKSVKIALNRFF